MLKLKKPNGDMEQAFLRACQLYVLLTLNNHPTDPGWDLIHYFESLGWQFDRQRSPYLLDGQHRLNALELLEQYRTTPEQLESQIERAMRTGPMNYGEFVGQRVPNSMAQLGILREELYDPPYTAIREYNPEIILGDVPESNLIRDNPAIAEYMEVAARRMAENVEEQIRINYNDLRLRGEPIAFTQDNRGHVRFAQPVQLNAGDTLDVTYTVQYEEELPDI